LKAVRALKSADVILYDNLVGDGVLDHARREAQVVSVARPRACIPGRGGDQCDDGVVRARGKIVVRLKGGDPFVFGRGGEEVDWLRASDIDVEGCPASPRHRGAASLQIPLTQRAISRSLTLVSGHSAGDGEAEFDQADFAPLATTQATIAVYMGVSTAGALGKSFSRPDGRRPRRHGGRAREPAG